MQTIDPELAAVEPAELVARAFAFGEGMRRHGWRKPSARRAWAQIHAAEHWRRFLPLAREFLQPPARPVGYMLKGNET